MLTKLRLKNFRAFETVDIPLTKINLFFGPNNSGKSSILSALTLLAQTQQSPDPAVRLLFDGKFENLGTYKDVVFNNQLEKDITIGLEFTSESPPMDLSPINYPKVNLADIEVSFHYRGQRHQTVIDSLRLSWPPGNILLSSRITKHGDNQMIEKVSQDYQNVPLGRASSGLIQLNHFTPNFNFRPPKRRPSKRSLIFKHRDFDIVLYLFNSMLNENLSDVEFVGPFRSSPKRIYPFSGEAPSSVGSDGSKAIHILAADQSRRRGKRFGTLEKVSTWFRDAHIARNLRIEPVTDSQFTVTVKNYETGETENLADAGYGCSQILPILVAGHHIPKGSKFILEQPEIHLHPAAQAEIGTFLYQIAKERNLQLFIETHSEHLLLRLQYHVAAKHLSPDDINIFYVYSDQGQKFYERITLAEDGFFAQDWPKGFFPERLEETKKIARASR